MHFYDFGYYLTKTYISYLVYLLARPSCLILFYLVSDAEPAGVEAELAFKAVEPPMEREWQLDDVMYTSCWVWSFVISFGK